MDRFTRNYSIALGAIVLALLGYWLYSMWSPRIWEINGILKENAALAAYPYQFRVRALENGVATISTPRSPEFPAISFLALIHPELANLAQDDPKMVAAQQELIDHQRLAMALVEAQPDVTSVRWQLDAKWLAEHGAQITDSTIH